MLIDNYIFKQCIIKLLANIYNKAIKYLYFFL